MCSDGPLRAWPLVLHLYMNFHALMCVSRACMDQSRKLFAPIYLFIVAAMQLYILRRLVSTKLGLIISSWSSKSIFTMHYYTTIPLLKHLKQARHSHA